MRLRKGTRLEVRIVGYDAEGHALGWWTPESGNSPAARSAPERTPPPRAEEAATPPWEIRALHGARDDLVEVEIDHASPHRLVAWGRILRVLEPSMRRAQPFDLPGHRCGGCPFAHLLGEEQLWAKGERLAALAAQFPGAALSTPAVRPSEPATGYRNRGKYIIGPEALLPGRPGAYRTRRSQGPSGSGAGDRRLVLGAYLPRSHQVTRTLGCSVMEPAVERAAAILESLLTETRLAPYDERSAEGLLRYASIRANHREEVLVTLVTAMDPASLGGRHAAGLTALVAGLVKRVPRLAGVTLDVNPTTGNVLFSGQERVLYGASVLEERFGPALVGLTGHGFGQVNREQAAAIYRDAARAALEPLPPPHRPEPLQIWELYAGAGALSQVIAHEARDRQEVHVLGVERDEAAVGQARSAALARGLSDRLRFLAADVATVLDRLDRPGPLDRPVGLATPHEPVVPAEAPDVVVLDPPRAGCRPALLEALVRLGVPRVVYVSCDPESLGRDLGELGRGGYAIRSLAGYDMMPQTPHLEVLAVAEWGDAS